MSVFVSVSRLPVAPGRLGRSELAYKIGGADERRFPRTVLVPRLVAGLCGELVVARQQRMPSGEPRLRLGRAVVRAVTKGLRGLTGGILKVEMPHPRLALGSLAMEDRTRNVLERLLPVIGREAHWTVERYLAIPGFGARCLVDLLAAKEEVEAAGEHQPAPRSGPGVLAATTDEITALLVTLLPLRGAEVGTLLVQHRVVTAPLTLRALAELYAAAGQTVPFQIIHRDGVEIAVPTGSRGLATLVAAAAVRLVALGGVATAEMVAERVRVMARAEVTAAMVKRLLIALPRLRWLDDHMEWFSLTGDRSPMRQAIAKVFAVHDRVDRSELRAALEKVSGARHLPPEILDAYLSAVADCELDSRAVNPRAAAERVSLGGSEARLVALLATAGGELSRAALRRASFESGLSWATVTRLLKASPLLVTGPGDRVRLIGAPRRAPMG